MNVSEWLSICLLLISHLTSTHTHTHTHTHGHTHTHTNQKRQVVGGWQSAAAQNAATPPTTHSHAQKASNVCLAHSNSWCVVRKVIRGAGIHHDLHNLFPLLSFSFCFFCFLLPFLGDEEEKHTQQKEGGERDKVIPSHTHTTHPPTPTPTRLLLPVCAHPLHSTLTLTREIKTRQRKRKKKKKKKKKQRRHRR